LRITLDPPSATNPVGDEHTVTARVTNSTDDGQQDITIFFTVIDGPNTGVNGMNSTNANGNATFAYVGNEGNGTDTIQACYEEPEESETFVCAQTVTKVWNVQVKDDLKISLDPPDDLNLVGENHTVYATVTNSTGQEQSGKEVIFTVISGPNQGVTGNGTSPTDSNGNATFTYSNNDFNGTGTDKIQACIEQNGNTICSNVVEKEWTRESIALSPLLAENNLAEDTKHTVNATVQDLFGNPLGGRTVYFSVLDGPNAGDNNGTNGTNDQGIASFTYISNGEVGRDAIQACMNSTAGVLICSDYEDRFGNDAFKEWVNGDDLCPAVEPNPDELTNAAKGEDYNVQLTGFGGDSPYTFEAESLPDWLDLNGTTGLLQGILTEDGTFSFTITAQDANNCTGSREYTLVVCPTITFTPQKEHLPSGIVGVPYSQTIENSNDPNTLIQLTAGELPPGLDEVSGSYIIEGTPTEVGTWTFTLTADTGEGCKESKEYTIRIIAGAGPAKSVPTNSEWGFLLMALLMAGAALVVLRRRGVM
jgi:hypothetical protein